MINLRYAFAVTAVISILGIFTPDAGAVTFSIAGAGVLPKASSHTTDGLNTSMSAKLGFGAGLLIASRFSPYWGLETGAVYLSRTAVVGVDFLGTVISAEGSLSSIYIPLAPRIFLGRFFSLQAGGFYDLALSSGASSNYGVQGGARINLPLSQGTSLFVDGRYNHGLKDIGGSKASDVLLVLAGLTFGGGSK